jgi:hypothetical protein
VEDDAALLSEFTGVVVELDGQPIENAKLLQPSP